MDEKTLRKLVDKNNWLNECSDMQEFKIFNNVESLSLFELTLLIWACTNGVELGDVEEELRKVWEE